MFAAGAIYLVFEGKILANATSRSDYAEAKIDLNSRLILGVQVRPVLARSGFSLTIIQLGLVLLSMIVTRSSIYYVQARQGLPLGVLVVGWATLCKPQIQTS